MTDARHRCPRCGTWALAEYRQMPDGSWAWVWVCPVCGHVERVDERVCGMCE
ncbi:MAG: hypothetical protein IKG21_13275 [Atopobiaceae bacterium]|nr:hypothetical protein [Atopobiaceae bacterium]